MLACPGCSRHILPTETSCPFCGVAQRSTTPTRPGLAVVMGVALTGCGPAVGVDEPGGSTGGDPSTGADPTSSTTGLGSTSVMATSVGAVTTEVGSSTSNGTDASDTSSTTDWDDSSDTCAGFYGGCPNDAGSISVECDIWMDDCPRGEKCSAWANDGGTIWNASKCSPLDPMPAQVGEPCQALGSYVSGVDDCESGSLCFFVDPETNEGTCVETCSGSPEDPICNTGSCFIFDEDVLALCLDLCDPEASECIEPATCELLPHLQTHACVEPGA